MKPYYQHAGITIFHGDCREILPHLEPVDLCLTDPPYGIGAYSNGSMGGGKLAQQSRFEPTTWDAAPPDKATIDAVLRHGRFQILWGGNYFNLPPSRAWLVWDKLNGENYFGDCELAWSNIDSAIRIMRHRWQGMLRDSERDVKRVHPTQKPIALMKWCLTLVPNIRTVIDPFMGSGTTLVAAKSMGLSAIGIDTEEKYCAIAASRLSQEVLFGVQP